jgi:zinc protease
MPDLETMTFDDVLEFFTERYAPGNATLAVAGAVDGDEIRRAIESQFGAVAARPVPERHDGAPAPEPRERRLAFEDDVHLARLYMAWSTPPSFSGSDAQLDLAAHALAGGRASRLYRLLVYERQVAQDVEAFQDGGQLRSTFTVVVTARPGVSPDTLERAVRDEVDAIARDGFTTDEIETARAVVATAFLDGLRTVGGFGGRADLLNLYEMLTGDPGGVARDWERYETATAGSVREAVRRHVANVPPLVLTVTPRGDAP